MNKAVFLNKKFIFLTLLTLFFLVLFVKLGLWQVSRSYEKEALSKNYTQVQLKGTFDFENTLEIPDQIHNHKIGSTIITPFILNNKETILVNRGFIEKYNYENNKNNKPLEISGRINTPKPRFILGHNLLNTKENNTNFKIQYIDIELISNLLKKNISNNILLLEDINIPESNKSEIIFEKNWGYINISPEKHMAYAFQWFAMALALVGMYLYAFRKFKGFL